MKKKEYLKFGVLMMLAVCLITGSIAGTYAKYTSEKTSSDSITVARWSFKVNEKDIAKEDFNFDLFGDKTSVAPGDSGSFTMNLENLSDVAAKYDITFKLTNTSNVPIEFSLDGTSYDPELSKLQNQSIAAGGTDQVTVYWKWNSTDDGEDTDFAIKNTLDVITLSAKITASQAI